VQGRRQWRKMHLAMDTATSDIRAVEFTPGRDGDSPLLPDLRGQIPEDEQIGIVRALSGHRVAMPCRAVDGAYDTRRCHTAILARGPTPIIPTRKNGRACKEDVIRQWFACKPREGAIAEELDPGAVRCPAGHCAAMSREGPAG
jgi:hypothetical protein